MSGLPPGMTQERIDREDWIISGGRELAARSLCFSKCSAGDFLDFENGCVSVCKSVEDCQGWRALVGDVTPDREPDG